MKCKGAQTHTHTQRTGEIQKKKFGVVETFFGCCQRSEFFFVLQNDRKQRLWIKSQQYVHTYCTLKMSAIVCASSGNVSIPVLYTFSLPTSFPSSLHLFFVYIYF